MPIFEYYCEDCTNEFEILVNRSDSPSCPQCSSQKLEKLMSAARGRVASGAALPIAGKDCPPPEAGPCSPHCCRLP
ncbi:MAG TPA: hypothetical protein DCG12_14430 [Planctomycetaceae bacterium]|nr:hypothetical protein [Planctomycetaceae bacterium]